MGEIAAVGVHDDLPPGQTGVAVGAANDEIAGGVDVDMGDILNPEAVTLQNRGDYILPDIFSQRLDWEIRAVHDGDDHGVDSHHVALLVEFHRDLGLSVGAKQVRLVDALGQAAAKGAAEGGRQGHQFRGLGAGAAEHHALIARAADLVVGPQRNIGGLGVDAALNFHRVGVKAVAGIDIADLPDGLTGNGGVVNGSFRGDLAADDAEIRGDHGLTGHAGMGVLRKAGVQNGVGDGVRYFVRVSVGDTFRGKKSFFHFVFPFCLSKLKKKNRTPKIRCASVSNPHLSFAAGFGTLYKQVAGFHRAVPSTTLDKACMQFNTVFYTIF